MDLKNMDSDQRKEAMKAAVYNKVRDKDFNLDDDGVAMLDKKKLKVINENILEISPPNTEIILSIILAIAGFAFIGLLIFPGDEIFVIAVSIGLEIFSIIMCNVLGKTKLIFDKSQGSLTEYRPNHIYTRLFRSNIRRVFKLSEIEEVNTKSVSVKKYSNDEDVNGPITYMSYRLQLIISGRKIPVLDSTNEEKVKEYTVILKDFLNKQ